MENELAALMRNNYALANETIIKLKELVKKAENVRQIYPIVEVFRAAAEVLKLNKENEPPAQSTFFSDLMKEMFK